MTDDQRVEHVMFTTVDPTPRVLNGEQTTFPALTTLLYRVCDGDQQRFDEALRLLDLFIRRALALEAAA